MSRTRGRIILIAAASVVGMLLVGLPRVFADDNAIRITTHSASDGSGVYSPWSPDGTEIAFSSTRSGLGDIWVIPTTGGEARQITTHPAQESYPDWSPNGTEIAFTSNRSGNFDIWAIPVLGGEARQITTHPAVDSTPAWSPDGTEIAVSSTRSGNPEVWVMPASHGGLRRRVTSFGGLDADPSWSPDGALIVFTSNRSNGNQDLWVISPLHSVAIHERSWGAIKKARYRD